MASDSDFSTLSGGSAVQQYTSPAQQIYEWNRVKKKIICLWSSSAAVVITAFLIIFIISGTGLTNSNSMETEIRIVEATLITLIQGLFLNTPEPSVNNTEGNPSTSTLASLQLMPNTTGLQFGIIQALNGILFRLEYGFEKVFESLLGGEAIGTTNPCVVLPPSSPSGYYFTRNAEGSLVRVYCDMTRSCRGITGGWMRVANLDMTDPSQQCPSNFYLYDNSSTNVRTCVRKTFTSGCSSNFFSTSGKFYSKVCGRIIGYQLGTTNGFSRPEPYSIDRAYVDGISLTHGVNPYTHIWTFASAIQKTPAQNRRRSQCLCHLQNAPAPPPYVGNDYFCDSGNDIQTAQGLILYDASPLWDGASCISPSTCCFFNGPPWFFSVLPNATTDDILMRVCKNDAPDVADIGVSIVELYVR